MGNFQSVCVNLICIFIYYIYYTLSVCLYDKNNNWKYWLVRKSCTTHFIFLSTIKIIIKMGKETRSIKSMKIRYLYIRVVCINFPIYSYFFFLKKDIRSAWDKILNNGKRMRLRVIVFLPPPPPPLCRPPSRNSTTLVT